MILLHSDQKVGQIKTNVCVNSSFITQVLFSLLSNTFAVTHMYMLSTNLVTNIQMPQKLTI